MHSDHHIQRLLKKKKNLNPSYPYSGDRCTAGVLAFVKRDGPGLGFVCSVDGRTGIQTKTIMVRVVYTLVG